ncbi:helix-turn-helix transcriptional regulator [Micromonospora sp. NPDC048999]|uniref:helix-turn-helix transcriptional regulator n=1 Tax=Micromonospora sp. NPDC048999 TaxID=3155391 RepID=UPI0033E73E85
MPDAVTNDHALHDHTLAALVRRHRTARLLTQEQLAEAAGLSVRSVRNLETGAVRAPRTSSVRYIAEALCLDDGAYRQLMDAAVTQRTAPAGPPPRAITLEPGADLILLVGPTARLSIIVAPEA